MIKARKENSLWQKESWISHPTQKRLTLIIGIWLVGNFLLFLSLTDFFTHSIPNKYYLTIYSLMIMSTVGVIRATVNYFKSPVNHK
ncbi:MAG: hypothetical protein ABI266_04365 [Ginsengibacter sp.]